MPIHDWTRVDRGIFHDFHTAWIATLRTRLNNGVLPEDYYALAEQTAGEVGPDVLTLQSPEDEHYLANDNPDGTVALEVAAPKVFVTTETDAVYYAAKQRRLAIHHKSGNRIVAIIELISPSNKHSRRSFDAFIDKALSAIDVGIHLLLIDLQPPGPRDPRGIHDAIWQELAGETFEPPQGKDRTLVSYSAGLAKRAYVEPIAVGQSLTPMPLFLTEDRYVNVPLEETYQAAYEGVPRIYRRVLEGTP